MDGFTDSIVTSPEAVAKVFRKNPNTIRAGLQQGVFPWGYAIQTSDRKWSYIINRKRFEEIEGIELEDE